MTKDIVIMAKSTKHYPNYCIAGIDIDLFQMMLNQREQSLKKMPYIKMEWKWKY